MKKKLNRAEIFIRSAFGKEFLLNHLLQCKKDLNLNSTQAQFIITFTSNPKTSLEVMIKQKQIELS